MKLSQPLSFSRAACGTCLIALLLGSFARAQPLADHLPPDTAIYVGWSPTPALQQSKPARMLADESFMRPLRTWIIEWLFASFDDHTTDKLPPEIAILLADALQSQGCFAITKLNSSSAALRCEAALIIDLGDKRKGFEEHFKPLQERIKSHLGAKVQVLKLGGAYLWAKPDRRQKPELIWGFIGDRFVMLWGAGSENLLTTLQGTPPEKSLKTAANFAEAEKRLDGDSVIFSFVEGAAGREVLKHLTATYSTRELPEVSLLWPMATMQLGLDNVTYIAEKTSLTDGSFISRMLLRTNAAPKGLLAAVAQPPVDDAILKTIPPDPMVAAAYRLDPAHAYEQLKSTAATMLGDTGKKPFDDFEKWSAAEGIPLKEILEPLGDQWVIYDSTDTGGFALTGWTIVGTLRDPARFERSLDAVGKLIARQGAAVEEKLVDGIAVKFIRMRRNFEFFAPAWAIAGDKLIVGMFPQLVEDAVRQLKKDKSILDTAGFVAARKRAGNDGPMVFFSGPQVTRNAYPIVLLALSILQGFSGEPAIPDIPSMQHLLDYIGEDLVTMKAQDDGILITRSSENPLLSPISASSPPVWVLASLPQIVWFSENREREMSQQNLNAIADALKKYSNDKKKYPDTLEQLVEAKLVDPEVLDSPTGDAPDGHDYVYLGLPKNTQPKNTILIYDAADLEHGEGTSVLYTHLRVEFLNKDMFEKALKDAKAAMRGELTDN